MKPPKTRRRKLPPLFEVCLHEQESRHEEASPLVMILLGFSQEVSTRMDREIQGRGVAPCFCGTLKECARVVNDLHGIGFDASIRRLEVDWPAIQRERRRRGWLRVDSSNQRV